MSEPARNISDIVTETYERQGISFFGDPLTEVMAYHLRCGEAKDPYAIVKQHPEEFRIPTKESYTPKKSRKRNKIILQ